MLPVGAGQGVGVALSTIFFYMRIFFRGCIFFFGSPSLFLKRCFFFFLDLQRIIFWRAI